MKERVLVWASLALFGMAACGGESDVSGVAANETTTSTSDPANPAGLDCEPTERLVTVQSEFATNSDGTVDLEEAWPSPEEAVRAYAQRRFPSMEQQPRRRSENEFVFEDKNGRPALAMRVDSAPEGWYISLYHACERFESQSRRPR